LVCYNWTSKWDNDPLLHPDFNLADGSLECESPTIQEAVAFRSI
jgi:hypothetical protein